jgi:hypothetical protein
MALKPPPAFNSALRPHHAVSLPIWVARRYPAIHQALLEQAARDQGLADRSAVMQISDQGSADGHIYVRSLSRVGDEMQQLGVVGPSSRPLQVTRLLLRLMPGDTLAHWQLRTGRDGADSYNPGWFAREFAPVDAEQCVAAVQALRCEAACDARTPQIPPVLWLRHPSLSERMPAQRAQACRDSCVTQKLRARDTLAGRLQQVADEDEKASRWLETQTGRSAAEWR